MNCVSVLETDYAGWKVWRHVDLNQRRGGMMQAYRCCAFPFPLDHFYGQRRTILRRVLAYCIGVASMGTNNSNRQSQRVVMLSMLISQYIYLHTVIIQSAYSFHFYQPSCALGINVSLSPNILNSDTERQKLSRPVLKSCI